MNEQIKELITQAGGHWNHGDFNMPSTVEFQAEDIEKFAELIIRKCLMLCDQVDLAGADDCIDKIKEHFDVR